jgi:GNAT superfamily N-acetyltransferase
LISIAHPTFRPELLRQAIEAKYVRAELADVEGRIAATAPSELRSTMVLSDGTQVNFRPMHPTDEPRVRDLFYALSQQTVYYRYMTYMKRIPQKQMQHFVYVDHRNEVAIVATVPEAHGEDMIAVGRYYLDPRTNRAEVAFVVRDQWQGRGIGTFLLKHLVTIARRNGIAGFTAEVLRENKAMQHIFNNSDLKVSSRLSDNVYSFELEFA